MKHWLYLHFPTLQLDTLFAESAPPTALVHGHQHKIVQLNEQARVQGIQEGMGLASAATLCHELNVVAYDPEMESKALEGLAKWLYLVTSDIVLFPPQGLLLYVTPMLTLYAGLENYWQVIGQHLQKQTVHYTYSTGFSPLCAQLLAQHHQQCLTQDNTKLKQYLMPINLSQTGLPAHHVEALRRVGTHTIEALISLPLAELARRFDIDVVNYVGRLLGQFHHPLPEYRPSEAFCTHLTLLYELSNTQWLEKPLQRLLIQLEAFLRLRNQVAYELTLTLIQRDRQTSQVTFTAAQGEYHHNVWLGLCRLHLESVSLEHPVIEMTLGVARYGEMESQPDDLFQGRQGQQSEQELLSLLQAKLGHEQVHQPYLTDDPRPDASSRYGRPNTPTKPSERRAQLRPTLLYTPPRPLMDNVTIVQGPERIATGWWDNNLLIRDYFIARSGEGRWLWVYRTPEKKWWIHGLFS
ncbi:MAG: Y-family DNA polymerase [Vibrio sp.]